MEQKTNPYRFFCIWQYVRQFLASGSIALRKNAMDCIFSCHGHGRPLTATQIKPQLISRGYRTSYIRTTVEETIRICFLFLFNYVKRPFGFLRKFTFQPEICNELNNPFCQIIRCTHPHHLFKGYAEFGVRGKSYKHGDIGNMVKVGF